VALQISRSVPLSEPDTALNARGHALQLLENGEAYFPALFAAIDDAREEVILETYIYYEDEVGLALAERLVAAARRGVRVIVTVDGFGSPSFSEEFLARLTQAGVVMRAFDPQAGALKLPTNFFCRLHRKLAVVDRRVAFVGGINVWALHLRSHGEDSFQDYAVRVEGPVVHDILAAVQGQKVGRRRAGRLRRLRRRVQWAARMRRRRDEGPEVLLVVRDNAEHSIDIETMYRIGMRRARREIVIANAYFFPGYLFLRDLARTARRGVAVKLILQGKPDVPLSAVAASVLYDYLLAAGIEIYHYRDRAMHAKVAVIDDVWATVGSSNLDPISFGLNLEANLFVVDRDFASSLRGSLGKLLAESCDRVSAKTARTSLLRRMLLLAIYHLTRRMSGWGGRLLRREQLIKEMRPPRVTAREAMD
jgi:cardiolipin synthase